MPAAKDSPPPTADSLHRAALTYLGRYAATEAGLRRVLVKRIDRWLQTQSDQEHAAPAAAAARDIVETLVSKLAEAGAISDAGFAAARAQSLQRTGRSRRAIQARLITKGVAPDLAREAAGHDAAAELAAALVLLRRRRTGPFRQTKAEDTHPEDGRAALHKELGILARAGFARETAERALGMDPVEAEQRIRALRSGQDFSG